VAWHLLSHTVATSRAKSLPSTGEFSSMMELTIGHLRPWLSKVVGRVVVWMTMLCRARFRHGECLGRSWLRHPCFMAGSFVSDERSMAHNRFRRYCAQHWAWNAGKHGVRNAGKHGEHRRFLGQRF